MAGQRRPRTRRAAGTAHDADDAQEQPDGGWPSLPYTVYFPDGSDWRGADIEHPAPLPRIGDTVEYIDERGARLRYRVKDVIHTLQTAASGRALVRDGDASPNALARTAEGQPGEMPGGSGSLRVGLPEVFLERLAPARGARNARVTRRR